MRPRRCRDVNPRGWPWAYDMRPRRCRVGSGRQRPDCLQSSVTESKLFELHVGPVSRWFRLRSTTAGAGFQVVSPSSVNFGRAGVFRTASSTSRLNHRGVTVTERAPEPQQSGGRSCSRSDICRFQRCGFPYLRCAPVGASNTSRLNHRSEPLRGLEPPTY